MPEEPRRTPDTFGAPAPYVDLRVGPGEEDNVRFGKLLERLRWKSGLNRADAASKLGLSPEYLRLLEIGRRTPALGQMRAILTAYGAKGDVELISPQGYRQDLIVFDPMHGDGADPTFVEFTSRIREARRKALGAPDDDDPEVDVDVQRATEIGMIVPLLARSDERTLRKVRRLLESRST